MVAELYCISAMEKNASSVREVIYSNPSMHLWISQVYVRISKISSAVREIIVSVIIITFPSAES